MGSSVVLKEDVAHYHCNKNGELKDAVYTFKCFEERIERYAQRRHNVEALKASERAFNNKTNSDLNKNSNPAVAAAGGKEHTNQKGTGESKAGGRGGGGKGNGNARGGGNNQRSSASGAGKPRVWYFHNVELRGGPSLSCKAGKGCKFERVRVSDDELEKIKPGRGRSVSRAPSERSQGSDKSYKSKGARSRSPAAGRNNIRICSRFATGKPCKNIPRPYPHFNKEEIKAMKLETRNAAGAADTNAAKTE
jgi:hypothetical protein